MLDLNVVLDVLQRREPFYTASAKVLSRVVEGDVVGCLPSHAVTTIHYFVRRHGRLEHANVAVDWLLSKLEIVPQDRASFVQARSLELKDFEDAAVASTAVAGGCRHIVTRNVSDFVNSPVPAVTPEEALSLFEQR